MDGIDSDATNIDEKKNHLFSSAKNCKSTGDMSELNEECGLGKIWELYWISSKRNLMNVGIFS